MKTAKLKHALLALIVMAIQTGCGGNGSDIGRGPDGSGSVDPSIHREVK